jgi:hypothetical protein
MHTYENMHIGIPNVGCTCPPQGLRVRMGLHYAERGSMVTRLHTLTGQHVFCGPCMHILREVRWREVLTGKYTYRKALIR